MTNEDYNKALEAAIEYSHTKYFNAAHMPHIRAAIAVATRPEDISLLKAYEDYLSIFCDGPSPMDEFEEMQKFYYENRHLLVEMEENTPEHLRYDIPDDATEWDKFSI